MATFSPPIHERSTIELIGIKNSSVDYWQQDAIDQARAELFKRGVGREEEQKWLDEWAEEHKQAEIELQQQREKNAVESYTLTEMLLSFATAPFMIISRSNWGQSLWSLKSGNYKLKFKQRLILLITGTCFWILFFWLITKFY